MRCELWSLSYHRVCHDQMLSSDELWMYAPIVYNGMDLGIDLNISPPR